MKLVSKSGGIAAIRALQDEIKPLKGVSIPVLMELIKQRYFFQRTSSVEEANTAGAKFFDGRISDITIAELAVFNDAIHVTTTDTKDSEMVIEHLSEFLSKTLGFREPTTKPKRAFQSDLIVDFENAPDKAFKLFAPLMEFIQEETNDVNGDNRKVAFSRIDFGTDPILFGANVGFLIERRAGVLWSTNRFFCKAYMQTDAHLKALALMDKLLAKIKP